MENVTEVPKEREPKKAVIAKDAAEAEFVRFCDEMDIDIDKDDMTTEDLEGFEDGRRKIIRAITQGKLAIDDDGQPVLTLDDVDSKNCGVNSITFYEPRGSEYMAIDGKKKSQDMKKQMDLLAAMTKQSASSFGKMRGRNFKICMAIVGFFMS